MSIEEITLRQGIGMVLAFLIGSIPFSIVVGKLAYGIDVRNAGSGNPGATNTLRVLGTKAGIIVLLLDALKGTAAVMIGYNFGFPNMIQREAGMLYGSLAALGHMFTPYLSFKGGKGVATSIGVIYTVNPLVGGILTALFTLLLIWKKFVSLGSIIAAALLPLIFYLIPKTRYKDLIWTSIALAALVIWKHRSNIQRLLRGEENRFKLR